MHRSETLTNLSRPLESLRQLVQSGELKGLLAGDIRLDAVAPGRQRRLDRAGIDQLVANYAAGLSVYALAAKYRIDRGVVAQHLKNRGVELAPLASMTRDQVTAAVALYAEGKSSAAIGKVLGFTNKTVIKELRGAGVSIRPQVGRRT